MEGWYSQIWPFSSAYVFTWQLARNCVMCEWTRIHWSCELFTKWVHTARPKAGIQTNGKQGMTEARKEIVNHANEDTKLRRHTVNWCTLINTKIFVTSNQPFSFNWQQSRSRKGKVVRLILHLTNWEGNWHSNSGVSLAC